MTALGTDRIAVMVLFAEGRRRRETLTPDNLSRRNVLESELSAYPW